MRDIGFLKVSSFLASAIFCISTVFGGTALAEKFPNVPKTNYGWSVGQLRVMCLLYMSLLVIPMT